MGGFFAGERERERGNFLGMGGTSNERVLCPRWGGKSFPVCRWGWGDKICTRCCRGWEDFSVRGGVPNARGAADGMMLQATMRLDDALGDMEVPIAWGRKMNCWVQREPTGLSDSPIELPVQTIQFRLDCFPFQLARPDQNCDRPVRPVFKTVQITFLKIKYE